MEFQHKSRLIMFSPVLSNSRTIALQRNGIWTYHYCCTLFSTTCRQIATMTVLWHCSVEEFEQTAIFHDPWLTTLVGQQ